MKMTRRFIVECGDFKDWSEWEHEAVESLMAHIKEHHPTVMAKIEIEGRRLAQGVNGCGYYDDGKQKTGGWWAAQETFREAWRRNALKERLYHPDRFRGVRCHKRRRK